MLNQLGLIGYGLTAFAFAGLLLLLLTGWRTRFQGTQLVIAVAGSTLWAVTAAAQAGFGLPGIDIVWASEVLRNQAPILVMRGSFFILNTFSPALLSAHPSSSPLMNMAANWR